MEHEGVNRVKEHLEEAKSAYEQSRKSVRDLSQAAVDTSREAVAVTDELVRGHAWKLLGITFAIGMIAGLLFGRSSKSKSESEPR